MESRILVQELERFRGGQPDAERRVLFVLSRSSLFLVSQNDPETTGDEAVVVKARIVTVDGNPTACLFSSEETLRTWCVENGCAPYSVPVHGGDLALLMPPGSWILIDPGAAHEIVLGPEQLSLLNHPLPDMSAAVLAPGGDEASFQRPLRAADDAPPVDNVPPPASPEPVTPPPAPAAQGPIKRRFAPRTHPTTLFSAPTIEPKEPRAAERPRSMTSSNLRKIIKSLPSETE